MQLEVAVIFDFIFICESGEVEECGFISIHFYIISLKRRVNYLTKIFHHYTYLVY